MENSYWTTENKPIAGDLLTVSLADQYPQAYVEKLDGNVIWASDFLYDMQEAEWKNRAYNATYQRGADTFSILIEIEDRVTVKRRNYVLIRVMGKPQLLQRRASYRLPHHFDVQLRNRIPELYLGRNDCKIHVERFVLCRGIDISESGIGVTSSHDWNPGDEVECRFTIGDETFTFYAKVVRKLLRVNEGNTADPYIYRLGIMFEGEDDKVLRKIRRFIYSKQIALKKK